MVDICYNSIDEIISISREKIVFDINESVIKTYFTIGEFLTKYKNNSVKLNSLFSEEELSNMMLFYKTYNCVGNLNKYITWEHYKILIHVTNDSERYFLEENIVLYRWSIKELNKQINEKLFDKIMQSKGKEGWKFLISLHKTKWDKYTLEDVLNSESVSNFLFINK